jgi:hypothetical protein
MSLLKITVNLVVRNVSKLNLNASIVVGKLTQSNRSLGKAPILCYSLSPREN